MRALLFAAVASSCATVVPMQTASVVERGVLRTGASLSATAYCGALSEGVLLGMTRCTEYPDGFPLPELRGSARLGLGSRFDVGVSAQAMALLLAPERAGQVGLTLDVKGELLRLESGQVTHVVSTGLLGGAALSGRFTLPAWGQVEWGVPLFYGLRLERYEFVAAVSVSQRRLARGFAFPSPFLTDSVRVSGSLGVYRRGPSGWAVQLAYVSDPARITTGSTQLQFGWFFESARLW